ncbi:hypothetical protein [Streptomyces sp. NPDC086787]|uniref:hypothetical protein n=1 Tax=Streptomyces sp. NPDC086787 TaxID=3365759 RepID=UPI0038117EAF
MSTPSEPSQPSQQPGVPAQPSAYPYPHPQSPPAPGVQGYYSPTVAGHPQPGNPYAAQGPYGPAAAGGRGAGRAVLWAAVGAVAASAAWAAGVFVIGAGASPQLRGYSAPSNLCDRADYSSFKDEYPQDDSAPAHTSLKEDALEEGYCSITLKKTGSSYGDAYLSIQADLHKKTDPGPEFTATWKNYRKSHTGYDVEVVRDIGDEAYLVSQDTTSGSPSSGSRSATLAVRDGWVTYTMSYSAYLSTYNQDKDPPRLDDVTDWLRSDTKATLDRLKD